MDDGSGVKVELRGDIPREIADVLDAVASARRIPRNELVVHVLGEWAVRRRHEATLINRVARSTPPAAESAGKGGGT